MGRRFVVDGVRRKIVCAEGVVSCRLESSAASCCDRFVLHERVEWDWMLAGRETLCQGRRPEADAGFLAYRREGDDEALTLYLPALGSPTHPIGPGSYAAWCSTCERKTIYERGA